MVEDIRTLKAGTLVKIHDGLHYKLCNGSEGEEDSWHSGGKTKNNEVVLFLGLKSRVHYAGGTYTNLFGPKSFHTSTHYYMRVLRKGQLLDIFFHAVSKTNDLPLDIERAKYASYAISVVQP